MTLTLWLRKHQQRLFAACITIALLLTLFREPPPERFPFTMFFLVAGLGCLVVINPLWKSGLAFAQRLSAPLKVELGAMVAGGGILVCCSFMLVSLHRILPMRDMMWNFRNPYFNMASLEYKVDCDTSVMLRADAYIFSERSIQIEVFIVLEAKELTKDQFFAACRELTLNIRIPEHARIVPRIVKGWLPKSAVEWVRHATIKRLSDVTIIKGTSARGFPGRLAFIVEDFVSPTSHAELEFLFNLTESKLSSPRGTQEATVIVDRSYRIVSSVPSPDQQAASPFGAELRFKSGSTSGVDAHLAVDDVVARERKSMWITILSIVAGVGIGVVMQAAINIAKTLSE